MTKRLARFMDEVEHYDPTIVYRPGKLQVVSNALSRMAGQSEGEPADTDRFIVAEMEDTLFTADHADAAEINPTQSDPARPDRYSTTDAPSEHGSNYDDDQESNRNNHNSPYYGRIRKYLEKRAELDDTDGKFKDECKKYELRDRILYNARTGRRVILDLKFMKETLEFAHKDIGH